MGYVTEIQIWLNDKYREWEKSQPMPRQSVSDWARYIGLHPSVLINYMNGKRKPSGNNLETIAGKVGAEIYDKLKRPRPDPRLQSVISAWGKFTERERDEIARQAARALDETVQGKGREERRTGREAKSAG